MLYKAGLTEAGVCVVYTCCLYIGVLYKAGLPEAGVYTCCVYISTSKLLNKTHSALTHDTLTLAPYDDRTAAVGTDEMPFVTRPTDSGQA